jgi:hypothetical protein
MRDTSAAFDAAMESGAVTWVRPSVRADWAGDGYGADGSIDDLSGQAGGPIEVIQALDDGLPDAVSFVAGDTVAVATVPMAWGRGGLGPSQYFSPLRADSDVYGYDRDVAPVKIDVGAVTANGQERVRVYTGQMAGTPVKGHAATMLAISATRLTLAALVQPPPIARAFDGLTGTWPVSWTLAECGIYVSPPPRLGCRYWAPMHGSTRAFAPPEAPENTIGGGGNQLLYTKDGVDLQAPPIVPADGLPYWVDGAYLEAPHFRANTRQVYYGFSVAAMEDGDPLFEAAGAAGRVELMVRGDDINTNTTPGGSGWWDAYNPNGLLVEVVLEDPAEATRVRVGIRRSDRKSTIVVTDAGGTYSIVGSTPLPTDGAWYGIGAAWDYAANKLWLYYNGAVTTSAGLALSEANLSADPAGLQWTAHLPFGEVHVTAGAQANPDNYPWVYDAGYAWTAGAAVGRSRLDLVALAEPAPREAWAYLAALAQSELAALRVDEDDVVRYLPLAWWVLNDSVDDPVDALSTDTSAGTPGNVGDLSVGWDISKIRNSATVKYKETSIGGPVVTEALYSLPNVIPLVPGLTAINITFAAPAVSVSDAYPPVALSQAAIDALNPDGVGTQSYVTVNTATDGSGAYYSDADGIIFTVPAVYTAGGIRVTIRNPTALTLYLANDVSVPALVIAGVGVHTVDTTVTVTDANSVAIRGERTVAVDAPLAQTRENALWLATAIVGEHAYPMPRVEGVEVFGDPRRQPGDLVRVVDNANTGLDDNFRLVSVKHTVDGARYTQTVTGRRVLPAAVWDVSNWDECVWAE